MLVDALEATNTSSREVWKSFWSAQQRFFKLLCISMKASLPFDPSNSMPRSLAEAIIPGIFNSLAASLAPLPSLQGWSSSSATLFYTSHHEEKGRGKKRLNMLAEWESRDSILATI